MEICKKTVVACSTLHFGIFPETHENLRYDSRNANLDPPEYELKCYTCATRSVCFFLFGGVGLNPH
jgi:hypothetical protein